MPSSKDVRPDSKRRRNDIQKVNLRRMPDKATAAAPAPSATTAARTFGQLRADRGVAPVPVSGAMGVAPGPLDGGFTVHAASPKGPTSMPPVATLIV